MKEDRTPFMFSQVLPLLAIVIVGSLWGLLEATVGMGLRTGLTRLYGGAFLSGASVLFLAVGYGLTGRLSPLLILPVLAGLLRLHAGFLLGLPIMCGAVANAIYAFLVEAAVFAGSMVLLKRLGAFPRSEWGRGLVGVVIAVLASVLFLPVGLFTGVPACPLPGTNVPLCIWGMPVAAVTAAVGLPIGLRLGTWARGRLSALDRGGARVLAAGSVAFAIGCFVVATLANSG